MDPSESLSISFQTNSVFDKENVNFSYQDSIRQEYVAAYPPRSFNNMRNDTEAFSSKSRYNFKVVLTSFTRLRDFCLRWSCTFNNGSTPVVFDSLYYNMTNYPQPPFSLAQCINEVKIKINGQEVTERNFWSILPGLIVPLKKYDQQELIERNGLPFQKQIQQFNFQPAAAANKMIFSSFDKDNYRNARVKKSPNSNVILTPLYLFSNFFASTTLIPPGTTIELDFVWSKGAIFNYYDNMSPGGAYQANITVPTTYPYVVNATDAKNPNYPNFTLITTYIDLNQTYEMEIMKRWRETPWINNFFRIDRLTYPSPILGGKSIFRQRIGINHTHNTFIMMFVCKPKSETTGYDNFNLDNFTSNNVSKYAVTSTAAFQTAKLMFYPFILKNLKLYYEASTDPILMFDSASANAYIIQETLKEMTKNYFLSSQNELPIFKGDYDGMRAAPYFIPLNQEKIFNNNDVPLPVFGNYYMDYEITTLTGQPLSSRLEIHFYVANPTTFAMRIDKETSIYSSPQVFDSETNDFVDVMQQNPIGS